MVHSVPLGTSESFRRTRQNRVLVGYSDLYCHYWDWSLSYWDWIEPDGSVFPASLGAADIRDVLIRESAGLALTTGSRVLQVTAEDAGFSVHTVRQTIFARRLILATGGISWPQTGSTGDGYRFAEAMGHTVTSPRACLVPLVTAETWPGSMAGVSIHGVVGKVQVRILLCVGADFVGQGNWNGSLNGSHGTGVLDGTITFTDSPVPQIPVGHPIPVSGTWTSDFELPVPEFGLQLPTYVILFAIVTLVVLSTHRPTVSKESS